MWEKQKPQMTFGIQARYESLFFQQTQKRKTFLQEKTFSQPMVRKKVPRRWQRLFWEGGGGGGEILDCVKGVQGRTTKTFLRTSRHPGDTYES